LGGTVDGAGEWLVTGDEVDEPGGRVLDPVGDELGLLRACRAHDRLRGRDLLTGGDERVDRGHRVDAAGDCARAGQPPVPDEYDLPPARLEPAGRDELRAAPQRTQPLGAAGGGEER